MYMVSFLGMILNIALSLILENNNLLSRFDRDLPNRISQYPDSCFTDIYMKILIVIYPIPIEVYTILKQAKKEDCEKKDIK